MQPRTLISLCCGLLLVGCIHPRPALAATRTGGQNSPTSSIAAQPDRIVDGFPIWLGKDRTLDRVVVLVEGFDLQNAMSAPALLQIVSPAAERLLAEGMDLLVVDFPDSHLLPDALAPLVSQAVHTASRASRDGSVAVVGLSAGGIVARWALVTAELAGKPLPVHTLLLFDCPNRGARLNPALQALAIRYGEKQDREALTSEAARALIQEVPTEVDWKRVGPPIPSARRRVPTECRPTGSQCAAFFNRLWNLNDRRGYPRQCRVIAVAQGSRKTTSERGTLYRMWLPAGHGWELQLDEADRAPGSLLPQLLAIRFRIRMPLGIGGAYLRSLPTFIPTESALDSLPGETPPFDAWYARSDDAPAIAHDSIDPGAVAFVVNALLEAQGRTETVAK